MPILPNLWKLTPPQSELASGVESILDIKSENTFLRKIVLFLTLVAIGQTAALLIKANSPRSAALAPEPDPVAYAEEVQRSSQTAISVDSSLATPITAANTIPAALISPTARSSATGFAPLERNVARKIQAASAERPTIIPAPQPSSPPAMNAVKTEPSFWDLLRQVQTDPDREILDRTFSANGLAVHLREVCKAGILHFELENTSQRVAYLPKISVPRSKSRAYFERQVLEPDTSQQGLLVFDDPKPTGVIDAVISAANVPPFKIRIDIPDWRKP